MSYEPLHHKYRPQTFGDLVGQSAIAQTLINAIQQEKIAPAYLFTGPRGTGKTSSARILAKSLNCLKAERPTPHPCGECEVCKAIAVGTALDIIEIDAASNTGVDNIREIIERSQFAPVQSRYKVYAIDECLTGDSLIQTSKGLMRIDDPKLKGKMVLSYNENTEAWEYKKVLRWLDQGTKKTLVIKTSDRQIRCTENHLIRTDKGWIEAKNVKEGMKILSPVNVDVVQASINMARMDEYADLQQDISLEEINTEANLITLAKFSNKQKLYNPYVNADVTKNSIFPTSSKKKEKALKVSNRTGKGILTEKVTESGSFGGKISLIPPKNWKIINWDSYTEHYLGMEPSNIQTHTVDSQDYAGHMVNNSKNGWIIKQVVYNNCIHKYKASLIEDMAKNQLFAIQFVILSYKKFIKLLNQKIKENQFRCNGLDLSHQKDLHGGTWMMALSNLVQKEVLPYFFTLRGFLNQKIKLLLTGLQIWDILPVQNLIKENLRKKLTTTSDSEQNLVENGYQICNNTQFPQWTTNLEKVESVRHDGHEKVYDLEVEDNHNFVANGLLVHNCHMLSTAAFNALLKTLEEPPPRVVFILATTDPQRVLPTIISRCQRFDYRRIPLEEMVKHLEYIAQQEQIDIDLEAIKLVGQIANGGLRDAESLLDQLSLFPGKITIDQVWDLVGAIPEQDLLILLQEIRNKNFPGILKQCRSLLDRGREPITVLQNLASFYLNLLIAKSAPQSSDLVSVTENCWKNLQQEASQWQQEIILWGQQKLKEAETQIKNTTQPRLWLEVTLFGLLSESPITSILNESVGNGSETSTLRLDTASPQLNGIKQPRHPSPAASPDFKISATNLSPSNPVPLGQHQEGESIVLESISSTAKIEGNSPIPTLASYEGADSVVLRQNSDPPPDERSDRTQSSRQSSIADLNRNGVTSPPVQQLAPKRDSMEKTPDKVLPESKLEKVVSPTTTQDTTRYTETVKEQSESIAETEPVPVTESFDDSNIPASFESQSSLSEVDKEEIWQKAIAILKPPTTRTLLSQKCHLISIQDSMAIMGITSPKLRKLFQEKVSNIETAFSQVCQRTIKVTLEIAPNGAASAAKVSPPQAEVGTRRPVNTETHQETGEENNSSVMNVTPYKPPKSSNLKPEVDTNHSLEAKQDTFKQDTFKQDTFKNGFNRELETPQEKIRDITPDITTSSEPEPDISAVTTSIPESQSLPETVVDNNLSESEVQGGQTTVVSSEAEFTKAVELIAKSFDGEIITLDNYSYTEESPRTQGQIVETQESLPPETTTDNDISNDISLKKKENYDRGIVSNRPDCSMYDYEDVPFARPINLEIKELELQDSWEWAVNQPGKWLYGKNYLLS